MIAQLRPCIPPLWAKNGHIQTIFAYYAASPKPAHLGEEVIIPLPDGDKLTGHLHRGSSPFVVLLFHGLTGSIESNYMGRTHIIAEEMGHSVLMVNHRGCGSGQGLAKNPYHSGRGEDISEVVAFARKILPDKKQIAIGFSLSANALLLLLAGVRGEHKPDFAMAINGPLDLKSCADYLKQGINRLYDYNFVKECKKDIYYKQDRKLIPTQHRIPFWYYLEDIDRIYTAPAGGFESREHYYETCSAAPHLGKIKTPTFILTSKDDPFIVWKPYLNAAQNPHVQLHIEENGGHLGYIARTTGPSASPFHFERWLDYAIKEVLGNFTR